MASDFDEKALSGKPRIVYILPYERVRDVEFRLTGLEEETTSV